MPLELESATKTPLRRASLAGGGTGNRELTNRIYNYNLLELKLANFREGACKVNPDSFQCTETKLAAASKLLARLIDTKDFNGLDTYLSADNKKIWDDIRSIFTKAADIDTAITDAKNELRLKGHIIYRSIEDSEYNAQCQIQLKKIKATFNTSSTEAKEDCFRLFQSYILLNDSRKHEFHAQGASGKQSEGLP
jgi:hypothetical protein